MKKLYRALHKARVAYWSITKPKTKGARALLIKDDHVFLVKHPYQDKWYIPGGKVKKNESFVTALRRELTEEIGVTCHDLSHFGLYENHFEHKHDQIEIYLSEDFTHLPKKHFEIEDFGLFPLDQLPEDLSPGTRRRINEYKERNFPNKGAW